MTSSEEDITNVTMDLIPHGGGREDEILDKVVYCGINTVISITSHVVTHSLCL